MAAVRRFTVVEHGEGRWVADAELIDGAAITLAGQGTGATRDEACRAAEAAAGWAPADPEATEREQ